MTVEASSPLEDFARDARAAWPEAGGYEEAFAAHVSALHPEGTSAEALAKLHGADLYLAFACARGDAAAWRTFERTHLSKIQEYVRRVDRDASFADDVHQRLAAKLATNQGKLALYTGRGPLAGFVRVSALREAHDIVRRRKGTVDFDDAALEAGHVDPELALLQERAGAALKTAFREVMATLPDEDKAMLKLHYLDGRTIEDVGKALRISRATATRRLADARERIVKRVELALRSALGPGAPGAGSLLRLVASQFDLSLARHFGSALNREGAENTGDS